MKIILLDPQNNYIESLNVDNNAAKNFNILATSSDLSLSLSLSLSI